jgi:CO/xanthine dehydrogenase Mo-binding subunit
VESAGTVIVAEGGVFMKKKGIGIGCIFYGTGYGNGFPDVSTVIVEILEDASVLVLTGAADCGQGSTTVLAQIAAEEVGVPLDKIVVHWADTGGTPDSGTTAATRHTYATGNAVRLAAQQARNVLLQWARRELEVNAIEGLSICDGHLLVKNYPERQIPLEEICQKAKLAGEVLIGKGTFTTHTTRVSLEDGQGAPYWPYTFGVQIAEVEVDLETGKVDILRIVAAHDVGRAINPVSVEGQIEGGIAQGVGWSLYEAVELQDGRIKNPSFSTYLMPTVLDLPEMELIIVEDYEPSGPYGAKGIGEPALLPTAPAILNAIYNATGVRINDLPATPEKVLAALKKK